MATCIVVVALVIIFTSMVAAGINFKDLSSLLKNKCFFKKSEVQHLHFEAAGAYQNACPMDIEEDENPLRAPRVIHRVLCKSGCSHCKQLRVDNVQFSCVQIYKDIQVYYIESKKWDTLESYPSDCRCQAVSGQPLRIVEPYIP